MGGGESDALTSKDRLGGITGRVRGGGTERKLSMGLGVSGLRLRSLYGLTLKLKSWRRDRTWRPLDGERLEELPLFGLLRLPNIPLLLDSDPHLQAFRYLHKLNSISHLQPGILSSRELELGIELPSENLQKNRQEELQTS